MARISFKTVSTIDDTRRNDVKIKSTPIGIKTPMQLGSDSDGIFSMHYDFKSQAADNLKNLIMTNWGERVGQYNLGANLKYLSMELTSDEFDLQAMTNIKTAVEKFMPYITLIDFESRSLPSDVPSLAKSRMSITYNIPAANIQNNRIDVIIYFGA